MKNVRETKSMPFVLLLPADDRKDLNVNDPIPERLKPLADSFGIKKLLDPVNFTASAGSFIFDVYDALVERPKAPLAAERENAKRAKLAQVLDTEGDVEVPDDVGDVLVKAFESDSEWEKVKLNVSYKNAVNGNTEYAQMTNGVIEIFPDSRQAILDYLTTRNAH